jgi:hypothetical protein
VVMIAGMDSTRRTEMFVDSEADRRADTATWGEERTMLVGSLRAQRATLELKCASLEGADFSRRSVEPSTLHHGQPARRLSNPITRCGGQPHYGCAGKDDGRGTDPRPLTRTSCPDERMELLRDVDRGTAANRR